MASLTDLTQREIDLPDEADLPDILRLADEVQAFGIAERNPAATTPLLTRLARRIHPSTPETHQHACEVISLARAGLHARELNAARDDAYQSAYKLVRIAIEHGMTEVDAARISGFDRMTVRKAIGKPRGKRNPDGPKLVIVEEELDYPTDDSDVEFDLHLAAKTERPQF